MEEILEDEPQEQEELRYVMEERMYDPEDMYTDDETVEDARAKDQSEKTKVGSLSAFS